MSVLFLTNLGLAFAATEKLTTSDWVKISEQRKYYYIFGQREAYAEKGVVFSHTPADYLKLLDEKARTDRMSFPQDMDEIFDALVHEKEKFATKPVITSEAKQSNPAEIASLRSQ